MELALAKGIVIFVGVIVFVFGPILGGGFYFARRERNRRRGKWKELATISGLTYHDTGTSLRPALRKAPIGESRKIGRIRQALTGNVGELWLAIVEAEENDSGNSARGTTLSGETSATTYCILIHKGEALPTFTLSNKLCLGFFSSLMSVAMPGIVFSDDKRFTAHCSLESSDEAAVRALFNDSVREYFRDASSTEMEVRRYGESKDSAHPLAVHVSERSLTITCPVEMEAHQIEAYLDKAKAILAVFSGEGGAQL